MMIQVEIEVGKPPDFVFALVLAHGHFPSGLLPLSIFLVLPHRFLSLPSFLLPEILFVVLAGLSREIFEKIQNFKAFFSPIFFFVPKKLLLKKQKFQLGL